MSIIGSIVTRNYTNFRGIDLLNPANSVDLSRSPDALNVWKSYDTTESNIIQTRPGFKKIATLGEDEIHSFYIYSLDTAIVHCGTDLIEWKGFPSTITTSRVLHSNMLDSKSVMFFFSDELYILDGKNYLKYNGTTLSNVADNAYIPTTSISRSPSGGGEIHEDINLLTGKRKNSFLANGTDTIYYLDAVNIDSVDKVTVNDTVVSNYTVNTTNGSITFSAAPSAPAIMGQDNVVIEFTKVVDGYLNRILNCTIATVFDNRIFFSGNSNFSNVIFHSSLNTSTYISDLDYYECGSMKNDIKALVVGNNVLWVLKEENQNKDTIFYLTPTTDNEYGRIYPTSQGNIAVGCYVSGINYQDNIVFLSKDGLEGIDGNVAYEQAVSHKSSLVDSKLKNMSNYAFANIAEYKGYLLISIDDYIFFADYRQRFKNVGHEFEWYLWKLPIQIAYLKTYNDKLYFGDREGNMYVFDGTNDDGEIIESYWTTPRDNFGYMNHLKTVNKRGSIVKIKNIQNSKIKISEETNKNGGYKLILEKPSNGFDFRRLDFSNFTFYTGDNSYAVFRIKEKKIIDISIKVFSDEKDKPFGLSGLTIEAFIGGYVKRS